MDKLHDDSAETFCPHHPWGYIMPCVWSKIYFGSGAGTPIFVHCAVLLSALVKKFRDSRMRDLKKGIQNKEGAQQKTRLFIHILWIRGYVLGLFKGSFVPLMHFW